MSALTVSASPPFTGSTVRLTLVLVALAAVTLWPSLNLRPCLARMRWVCLQISPSMPGRMRSRNSITVTLAPSRDQTEPSSSPMTPAPITTICFGTLASSRAPVELTMRSSSTSTPGRGVDSEPVAIRMFLAARVSSPPALSATLTSPALGMLPLPTT